MVVRLHHLCSITLCAVALAVSGCGDTTGDQSTENTTVVGPDDSPYFDGTATQTELGTCRSTA